jgi:hypothetical protein
VKVKPMIGEYEVPGIQRIGSLEARHLVEVPVPGLEGSYHQDLGSAAVSIVIEGTLAGDDARDGFLQSVRDSFNAGEPLDFVADIVSATSVEKVFVADLDAAEVAGSSDTFRYRMVLTQYVEPPPTGPGTDLGFGDLTDLGGDLLAEAGSLMDALQVPDLLGSGPDISDPTPPLKAGVEGIKSALNGLSGVGPALSDLFGS